MYDELIKRLRGFAVELCKAEDALLVRDAADAIDELDTLLDGVSADNDALCETIERLKKPRWIPVTERLPNTMREKTAYSGWSEEIAPSDDVICYLGSEKRQTVAWYSHTYKEWTTVDENTVYKYGEVTHWMPLPQPPKEET